MAEQHSFGAWVQRRRKQLDLTQQELSRLVHCSLSTVQKYENDALRPAKAMVARLAEQLAIPPEERAAFARAARQPIPPRVRAPRALPPAAGLHNSASQPPWFSGGLPVPPTPLFGREDDAARAADLLRAGHGRLLTLLGPPGVGKSRLALEIAARVGATFADGVAFVALAPVSDHTLVVATIAQALRVRPHATHPLFDTLVADLARRNLLLILDNCEHVLEFAPLAAELLAACPALYILATSREALNLRAEQRFPVAPLPLPNLQSPDLNTAVRQAPATAMLLERARAVAPDFRLHESRARAVAAICARLDGLPLAIELAAARLDALSPDELLAQIDRRFTALANGPRDLPPHQRTLRHALVWSYSLLTPSTQAVFAQLGVFAGGCTLAAATAVCAPFTLAELQAALDALVAKNLVQQRLLPDGTSWFTMLETLREYALEQLAHSGQQAETRQRHAGWVAQLAAEYHAHEHEPNIAGWFERLDLEIDNIRAAIDWSLDHDGGIIATKILVALTSYWHRRSKIEGERWIVRALQHPEQFDLPNDLFAEALHVIGFQISQRNDWRSLPLLRLSLAVSRAAGDRLGIARALKALGMLARYPGNARHANALLEEGLVHARALGAANLTSSLLNQVGMLRNEQGLYLEAEQAFTTVMEIVRSQPTWNGLAFWLPNLAEAVLRQGDLPRARALFEETMAVGQARQYPEIIAEAFNGFGMIALTEGDLVQAKRHFDQSAAVYQQLQLQFGVASVRRSRGYATLEHDPVAASADFAHALAIAYTMLGIEIIAHCLAGQAWLACQHNHQRAARLLGASRGISQAFGLRAEAQYNRLCERVQNVLDKQIGPMETRKLVAHASEIARQSIGAVQFESAIEAAEAINLEQAVAAAVRESWVPLEAAL